MPDDLPYGERCKTYTGMPVPGTRALRPGPPPTWGEVNAHLAALPRIVREEEARRDRERFQRYVDKLARQRLTQDIREAKRDVRRVRCACKDCRRYVRTVRAWIGRMETIKKENR